MNGFHTTMVKTNPVLTEVLLERVTQDEKWGEQNHPNGTGPSQTGLTDFLWQADSYSEAASFARQRTDDDAQKGVLTFEHILSEEFFEALAEEDPQRLREELIQVAAVAVAWVEKIDRDAAKAEAA